MKPYRLDEIEHLKVHGRTTPAREPLTLFWTGSGIELNVTGSELHLEVETDYNQYEQWASIWINGAQTSRLMLPKGRHWLTLFRGMNPATVKHVLVIKEVQAMSADEASLLQLHRLSSDGTFQPVAERPYRIEFIGDSLTSGEGAVGAVKEEDWIAMWFSAGVSYTKLTADALDAEYRVLSQSGWGVLSSWNSDPRCNMPAYYDQVCGLLTGERNQLLGARSEHPFSEWQPHVIVVNLGTNDYNSFHQPEWQDEQTGASFKQRLLEDGSFHPEDEARFEAAAQQFLHKLRLRNPEAQLVWAYGMLGAQMLPAIYRAVDRFRQESGDKKTHVFQLPSMKASGLGARWHPGQPAHAQGAEELAAYIRELLPETNR